MTKYFILEEEDCLQCRGSGIFAHQNYNPARPGELLAVEEDCEPCKGKGYTLEPVELTEDLIRSLLG